MDKKNRNDKVHRESKSEKPHIQSYDIKFPVPINLLSDHIKEEQIREFYKDYEEFNSQYKEYVKASRYEENLYDVRMRFKIPRY